MATQQLFFDWVNSGLNWDAPPYESCSPNLLTIKKWLDEKYVEGTYLGCHADREIRLGGTPSEHSWGAAMDWSYEQGKRIETADYLISVSAELGICAIHDYLGCRIWRAGRYPGQDPATWWRAQTPNTGNGMGQAWATYFHLVTTFDKFADTTPIPDRLPPEDDDMKPCDPYRSYDSRDTRGPLQPGETILVPVSLWNEASVHITAIGQGGSGFFYINGADKTSVANFSPETPVNADTVPVKTPTGHITVTCVRSAAHVVIDVFALG